MVVGRGSGPTARWVRAPWKVQKTAAGNLRRCVFFVAFERFDDDGFKLPVFAFERNELIGDDHLDLAAIGQRLQLVGRFRRAAEFGAAVDDVEFLRSVPESEIAQSDSRIAAAGDHHFLAAEIFNGG